MPLSDIVRVTITTQTANPTQAGFGVPLILSASTSATWTTSELVRFYSTLTAVGLDFAAGTPEFKAASAIFAQNPAPSRIAIGRLTDKPVMSYAVGLVSPATGVEYTFQLNDVDISFLSVDSVNDNIIAGIVAAITSAAIPGVSAAATGPGGSQVCTITGTAGTHVYLLLEDGEGNSTGPDKANLFTVLGTGAEPATPFATQLGAILLETSDFYALVNPYYSQDNANAIALWVEANERLFIQASMDTGIITVPRSSATDIADDLADAAIARTAIMYHHAPEQFADAAWFGRVLPEAPGSVTWKFKTLATITPSTLTGTHITNLKAKFANYYYTVAGINVTADGAVAADEWIDVVRGRDWLKARTEERVFARLINSKKIPFTDAGVAIIESEVRAQLVEGVRIGLLAADPAPTVTVPKVADVSTANKLNRLLPDVNFTAFLAGAIHELEITGTLLV